MITKAKEVGRTLRDIRRGYDDEQEKKGDAVFKKEREFIEKEFNEQLQEALDNCENGDLYFHFIPTAAVDIKRNPDVKDYHVRVALGRKIVNLIKDAGYKVRLMPNETCPDYLDFSIDVPYNLMWGEE